MKKGIIVFTTIVLAVMTIMMSFSKNTTYSSVVNCSIELSQINDSTYVVQNYSGPYVLTNQVLSGNPVVTDSNDTIQISGSSYSLILMARDSSNCLAQKIINKY